MKRAVLLLLLCACDPYPRREFDDEWERARNLPTPEGNVRVSLEYFEYEASDRAAFAVAAEGSLVAAWTTNGLRVLDARVAVDLRAAWSRERTRTRRSSSLLVADGYDGEMAVVQEMPMAVTYVIPIYDGAVVVRTIEVVPVGSGFRVRPRKRADGRIELELTPWVRDAKRGTILITELSTRLTVEAGRPVVIAEHESRRESLGLFFFARGSRRVMMAVTAE